jgi:hypothetical protein
VAEVVTLAREDGFRLRRCHNGTHGTDEHRGRSGPLPLRRLAQGPLEDLGMRDLVAGTGSELLLGMIAGAADVEEVDGAGARKLDGQACAVGHRPARPACPRRRVVCAIEAVRRAQPEEERHRCGHGCSRDGDYLERQPRAVRKAPAVCICPRVRHRR